MLVIHLPINHMEFNHTCHLRRFSPEKLFSFCSLLHLLSIIWKLFHVFIYLSKVHIQYACTNFLQGSGPGRSYEDAVELLKPFTTQVDFCQKTFCNMHKMFVNIEGNTQMCKTWVLILAFIELIISSGWSMLRNSYLM